MHQACLDRVAKKLSAVRVSTRFKGLVNDEKFLMCVMRPIARGGRHTTLGNGNEVIKIRRRWKDVKAGGGLDGWEEEVQMDVLWPDEEHTVYYRCPVCQQQRV